MANLAPTPKVAAAVVGGIIASAFLANITLITPDLFDGLGKWSGLVYGLTITLVMGVCGWLKSEEAKAEGDAQGAPASDTPVASQATVAAEPAPAATFPKAAVEAALAAAEPATPAAPAEITPVYVAPETPAPVA